MSLSLVVFLVLSVPAVSMSSASASAAAHPTGVAELDSDTSSTDTTTDNSSSTTGTDNSSSTTTTTTGNSSSTTGTGTTSSTEAGGHPLTTCNNNDCYYTRISGLINLGSNLRLHLTYLDKKAGDGSVAKTCTDPSSELKTEYLTAGSYPFCLEAYQESNTGETRLVAYYDIYSSSGQSTGYYVDMYAKVPFAGANELACTVKKKGESSPPPTSPYLCTYGWGDSNPHSIDPQPHWTIAMKPTVEVTDDNTAVELLNAHCSSNQTPECSYKATSQEVQKAPKTDWLLYGQPYGNCTTKPDEPYSLGIDRSLGWQDSIQVKVSAKFSIGPVQAEVDAQYKHSVTAKYDIKQTYGTRVKYLKIVGFYIQPGYLRITGDWLVTTADAIYSIKNFTLHLPLGTEYSPPGHPELKFEPSVIYSVEVGDATCAQGGKAQPTSDLAPDSPPPDGSVVLGQAKVASR
jgi:hypothetical protein